ncbi:MAG: hypothetical protein JNL18_20830 [Planctomycetaceae bacterium]|nr:hypothetical protein [Planctomycetaceae bacterium]
MRRILVQNSLLLTALAAGMPCTALAAEPEAGGLFAKLDVNSDGRLAAEEVGNEQRLLFRRLIRTGDSDGDGELSASEFAAALLPVRAEKATVEKQGSRLPGADALVVLLVRMDANGDQQLDAEEIPADYQRAFQQMLTAADDDKNGRLDRREIAGGSPKLTAVANLAARRMGLDVAAEMSEIPEASMAPMEQMDAYPQPGEMLADPKQAEKLFTRLDANGDQQIVAKEVEGPFAELIDQMIRRGDGNDDQRLNKREFLEMAARISAFENDKPKPAAVKQAKRQLLNRFDRNGDSALSAGEAPPRLRQNFAQADANGDGELAGDELQQVAERMARAAPFAENRNGDARPAMNEDSPSRKSSRKLKGKSRAEKKGQI